MKNKSNSTYPDLQNIAFCTYFDKNYILKGMAMLESLITHNPEINIWVIALDSYTEEIIKKLNKKNITVVSLKNVEDNALRKAKKNRSLIGYYFTLTPSSLLYVLKENKRQYVGYIDADMFFYGSIKEALDEFKQGSIFTVEHRFPKWHSYRSNTAGRFNVAFQIFKRDAEAIECLKKWREECLKWCDFRFEGHKFGDQLYLNTWPDLYPNLVISNHKGLDVAPWNISQYKVYKKGKNVYVDDYKLISYHFHQFNFLMKNKIEFSRGYNFKDEVIKFIYVPYIKNLKKQIEIIKKIDSNFNIPFVRASYIQNIKNLAIRSISPSFWTFQTLVHKII